MKKIACVDLYCGVGGLSYGLKKAGVNVVAGIDVDESCKWGYERNVEARFVRADVADLSGDDLCELFPPAEHRLLAGCAPCQPFSTYGRTRQGSDDRWSLLREFSRLVEETKPEFVTMENVEGLASHRVFGEFLETLEECGYAVAHGVLACERFGVPQRRRRLVLVASRIGDAVLPEPDGGSPRTVRDTIERLPPIAAGGGPCDSDRFHVAAGLSELNLRRIRNSVEGGSWRDWPKELRAPCHRRETGATYPSVYGRMRWDEPAPTITTQCYAYGSGRFGHPEQDRAISLREAAMLQSFPSNWEFVPPGEEIHFATIGRAIGNAVPPKLAEAVGRTIITLSEAGRSPRADAVA